MPDLINNLYADYENGTIERKDFEGLIFQQLMKDRVKYNLGHWNNDEYEDYLSWAYLRIHKAIDKYRNKGASFDAFLNTVIRLTAKEYRMRTINKSIIEYTTWGLRVPELYAYDEIPAYLYDTSAKKSEAAILKLLGITKKTRRNPRQLLVLILKCYSYVSDDFIERISPKTGIDKENLKEMIEKIRLIRQKRDDELFKMKERIYCQFYRCIICEKKLSLLQEDSIYAVKIKEQLKKSRKRLESMRVRISGINTDATNREIANIMGISKGAVDSSLYSLKTKWNIVINKSTLN